MNFLYSLSTFHFDISVKFIFKIYVIDNRLNDEQNINLLLKSRKM